jgi:hypothetical protein
MREEPVATTSTGSAREDVKGSGLEMARRYPIALALYVVLALLSWFTLDGRILVFGRPVELRLVPLVIICGLALRTMLAMQAEKIRRGGEKSGN